MKPIAILALLSVPFATACGSPPSKPANASTNAATNSQNVATNSQNVATNSQNVATNSQNVMTNNVTTNNQEPYPITLDESCDGNDGFTPSSLFDRLDEFYESTLRYNATQETTYVALEFFLTEGEILCHPHISPPPGSLAPEVPARIQVPVEMYLYTEDGNFDEQLVGTLTGNVFGDQAEVAGQLLYSDLSGSWAPEDIDQFGAAAGVGISAFVAPAGESNGSIVLGGGNQSRIAASWPVP